MRPLLILSLLPLLLAGVVQAQPADCQARANSPDRMTLDLDVPMANRGGGARGANAQGGTTTGGNPRGQGRQGGWVGLAMQDVPVYGTTCGAAAPHLPRDVLHGARGDVLHGPAGDVLQGPPGGNILAGPQD